MTHVNHKPSLFKGLRLYCLLLLACMPLHSATVIAQTAEYKLKAALIYKLTKFVEWPLTESDAKERSFGICLLGRDDFGTALDALAEREVQGRRINIRRFAQSEAVEVENCQLLFISESKLAFMQSILDSFRRQPVLTISDAKQFADKGGMIQFSSGDKRIGFMINLERAVDSGLIIAAPLLELATIVDSQHQGDRR